MKKYACTFLALVLALALLAGCGSSGSSSGSSQTSSAASSAESQSSSADGEEIPGVTLDTAPVELIQFEEPTGPQATISTSMGDIVVVLFPQQAPKAVENFITHAKEGYYDGLLFHRVIDDFILEVQVRRDPLDHQLAEGAPHFCDGGLPVLVMDDEL